MPKWQLFEKKGIKLFGRKFKGHSPRYTKGGKKGYIGEKEQSRRHKKSLLKILRFPKG